MGHRLVLEGHWPGAALSTAPLFGCLPAQGGDSPSPENPPWGRDRGDDPRPGSSSLSLPWVFSLKPSHPTGPGSESPTITSMVP